jgi:hypothetical protein
MTIGGTVAASQAAIDKVRASRDGHEYHEAWAARTVLELLVPTTTLTAIALEGFSFEDNEDLSSDTVEIADLVRYRGGINLRTAQAVETVQFKYSIARADVPMRAADIRKTLAKFATTERDAHQILGPERAMATVSYEVATNRAFEKNLVAAIDGLRNRATLSGDAAKQAEVVRTAVDLPDGALGSFLARLTLTGASGALSTVKAAVHRVVADCGGASDALAKVRLANLRALVRDKAGGAGQNDNLINRVAVLAAIDIAHENELFPTPAAFPVVSAVIERPAALSLVEQISDDAPPLVVHAAGGMGKTVLVQWLAGKLGGRDTVVLFDGFGAGKWRDPADARHLPRRTLPHLANLLAGQGLCDLLLPSPNSDDLMRAFRLRLEQAVRTLRGCDPEARVVLILDGIDHAAIEAQARRSESFAHVLLQSLAINTISGVAVIASCRTERLDLACGGARCRRFSVPRFTAEEAAKLVQLRDPGATSAEISALHGRSGGNPRCLDALLTAGRPYDGPRPGGARATAGEVLDALIGQRISAAEEHAEAKGARKGDLRALLAGLALLPPPVPPDELAAAHGLCESDVESFASDLAPLLDRTPYGLIFRDEPTETLIWRLVKDDIAARNAVVERLRDRQQASIYAARAFPTVLTTLGRTSDLVALALNDQLPQLATSRLAQRSIRMSRLGSALAACAAENRLDDLTLLLLEAARVAGGHERSDRYLYEHPDLAAVSGDPEALRRLFEGKVGWPGGRHAALAVANAIAGDPGEARRNAWRAFHWLDWRAAHDEQGVLSGRERTGDQDLVGPAYVEVLEGNAVRVARWVDQWPEHSAYRLFAYLFNLIEDHAAARQDVRARRDRLVEMVARCRLKSRALLAAALRVCTMPANSQVWAIKRLAQISRTARPVETNRFSAHHETGMIDALIFVAIKAAHLRLSKDAAAILDGIGLARPRQHVYGAYWSSEPTVEQVVLAAGVRAAIARRSPNLLDITPRELVDAVPESTRRRGPRAFEAKLEKILEDPSSYRPGKQRLRKPHFDHRVRQEARTALQHRVRPMVAWTAVASEFIRSDHPAAVLRASIERLAAYVEAAEIYPYHDGRLYAARTGFNVLFGAAEAVGALTSGTAETLVRWLIKSPIKNIETLTGTVARLSRYDDTHPAALTLAGHVDALIATQTDVGQRIAAYGALARSVWLISPAEAGAYFRRGLDMADAIGSDDWDRAAKLVGFAAHYTGPPLTPATVHAFARICEINLPEEVGKFDWVSYGRALSRLANAGALAIVSRLADRDRVSLQWSLPPLLTALGTDGHLPPDLAAGLTGLDEPTEAWDWHLADLADALLPKLPASQREAFGEMLVIEVDREHHASPNRNTLDRLIAAVEPHLPSPSPVVDRLRLLRAEIDHEEQRPSIAPPATPFARDEYEPADPDVAVDLANPAAVDAALAALEPDKHGRRWTSRLLAQLAKSARGTDERRRYLQSVVTANLPNLTDKIWGIRDAVEEWRQQSAAIRDELPALCHQLASRHAAELIGSRWEAEGVLRDLAELLGRPGSELVPTIVAALRERTEEVGGANWLAFAEALAPAATPAAIGSALERFVLRSTDSLPDDLGDGPWHHTLAVASDPVAVVAGLLWCRLGAPDARNRWRAAHAVRRVIALGRTDVMHAVIAWVNHTDACAFQDRKLPFFYMHAKLWLLIALARVARDTPTAVASVRGTLEAVAFEEGFPHSVMRHLAAEALAALAPALDPIECAKLRERLRGVNLPTIPAAREPRIRTDSFPTRPEDRPEPRDPFHFEYEFQKHEVEGVARLFGTSWWVVSDACHIWIRRWDTSVSHMFDCPRRSALGAFGPDDHDRGRFPQRDRYGGYLAWHALMLTAGEFLLTRPVTSDPWYSWSDNPWLDWLAEHTLSRRDGLWLADGTDLFPVEMRRPLAARSDADGEASPVPIDARELAPLVGLGEQLAVGDTLIVDGHWNSTDKVDVAVSSVLTDKAEAREVAVALAAGDPFFQWLPWEDGRFEGHKANSVRPWIAAHNHVDQRLDRHDPYATPTALDRGWPTDAVVAELKIRSDDPFKRAWRDPRDVVVLRAEAWGVTGGSGQYAWSSAGTRLTCRTDALQTLLASRGAGLVMLVKAEKYIKEQRGDRAFATKTLVFWVDARGVHPVLTIPKAVRKAVGALARDERTELERRLAVVRQQMGRRRPTKG